MSASDLLWVEDEKMWSGGKPPIHTWAELNCLGRSGLLWILLGEFRTAYVRTPPLFPSAPHCRPGQMRNDPQGLNHELKYGSRGFPCALTDGANSHQTPTGTSTISFEIYLWRFIYGHPSETVTHTLAGHSTDAPGLPSSSYRNEYANVYRIRFR
jgi:hypothetical protein